jgi:uncharacterized membrane protein YphA (DoxX/SURF4 family)
MNDGYRINYLHTLRSQRRQLLATGLRLVLAVTWLWAGASKLPDPMQNVRAVRAYQILPEALVVPAGHGLPLLELSVGLLLLTGLSTRIAAAMSAALLIIFMAGIVSVWARGLSIDCGCFSVGGAVAGDTRYDLDLVRDGLLLALSLALLRRPRSAGSLDGYLSALHGGGRRQGPQTHEAEEVAAAQRGESSRGSEAKVWMNDVEGRQKP